MATLKLIESQKGFPLLLYNGYRYTKRQPSQISNSSDEISWRCARRGCTCGIKTSADMSKLLAENNRQHSHDALTDAQVEKLEVNYALKRKATEDISIEPRKLIREAVASARHISKRNIIRFRKNICSYRKKCILKSSNSLPEKVSSVRVKQVISNTSNDGNVESSELTKATVSSSEQLVKSEEVSLPYSTRSSQKRSSDEILQRNVHNCITKINEELKSLCGSYKQHDCVALTEQEQEKQEVKSEAIFASDEYNNPLALVGHILEPDYILKGEDTMEVTSSNFMELPSQPVIATKCVSSQEIEELRGDEYNFKKRQKHTSEFSDLTSETSLSCDEDGTSNVCDKSDLKVVESQRGAFLLIYNKYKYTRRRSRDRPSLDEISWTCGQKTCGCTVKTTTDMSEVIFVSNKRHNHTALTEEEIEKLVVKGMLRREAVKDISARPQKLICEAMATAKHISKKSLALFRKNIYRYRRKCRLELSNSTSLQETPVHIEEEALNSNSDEKIEISESKECLEETIKSENRRSLPSYAKSSSDLQYPDKNVLRNYNYGIKIEESESEPPFVICNECDDVAIAEEKKEKQDKSEIVFKDDRQHDPLELTGKEQCVLEPNCVLKEEDMVEDTSNNVEQLPSEPEITTECVSAQEVIESRTDRYNFRKRRQKCMSELSDATSEMSSSCDEDETSDVYDKGNLKVVESQTGAFLLIYNRYKYTRRRNRDRPSRGEIAWVCAHRNCGCSAKSTTDMTEVTFVSSKGHNHTSLTEEEVEKIMVKCTLRREAVKHISAKPNQLIHKAMATAEYVSRQNVAQFRKLIYRNRRRCAYRLLRSITPDIVSPLPDEEATFVTCAPEGTESSEGCEPVTQDHENESPLMQIKKGGIFARSLFFDADNKDPTKVIRISQGWSTVN